MGKRLLTYLILSGYANKTSGEMQTGNENHKMCALWCTGKFFYCDHPCEKEVLNRECALVRQFLKMVLAEKILNKSVIKEKHFQGYFKYTFKKLVSI